MRYFEDFHVGDVLEVGSRTVSEDEIIAFATTYDPQAFHVDPKAAASSMYGGLIASGWHTGAMMMRLLVDNVLRDSTSMGSPGLETLRWLKPVRPGDTLRLRITVLDTRPSVSRPERGSVLSRLETINQADEVVMTCDAIVLFGTRH